MYRKKKEKKRKCALTLLSEFTYALLAKLDLFVQCICMRWVCPTPRSGSVFMESSRPRPVVTPVTCSGSCRCDRVMNHREGSEKVYVPARMPMKKSMASAKLLSVPVAVFFFLSLHAVLGAIEEPFPWLHGGSFSGAATNSSPDPLVTYRWSSTINRTQLQLYNVSPVAVYTADEKSFVNLESLTTSQPNVKVSLGFANLSKSFAYLQVSTQATLAVEVLAWFQPKFSYSFQ